MRIKKLNKYVWFIGLLALSVTMVVSSIKCGSSSSKKTIYFYIPNATFHKGNPPPSSSSSNAPQITSVTPSKTSLTVGESVTFTVDFIVSATMVTETIFYDRDLGGYWEEPMSESDAQSGTTQIELGTSDSPPSADVCGCPPPPAYGTCTPCYSPAPQSETDLNNYQVSLIDASGIQGQPLGGAGITIGQPPSGSGGSGGHCNDGSSCCTTSNGIQVVGITTPLDCECPPNTTYGYTDHYYNVKECDCNACQ